MANTSRDFISFPKRSANNSFGDDGILFFLGTNLGKGKWTNPAQGPHLIVTRSNFGNGATCVGPKDAFTGRTKQHSHTLNALHSWYMIELINHRIQPQAYAIMTYGPGGKHFLMNWNLEASNDRENWHVLRNHKDDRSIHREGQIGTWQLDQEESVESNVWEKQADIVGEDPLVKCIRKTLLDHSYYEFTSPMADIICEFIYTGWYRYFRIINTGPDVKGTLYVGLSGFELWGNVVVQAGKVVYPNKRIIELEKKLEHTNAKLAKTTKELKTIKRTHAKEIENLREEMSQLRSLIEKLH